MKTVNGFRPLFLDGPLKGKDMVVEHLPMVVPVRKEVAPWDYQANSPEDLVNVFFEQVVYNLYQFKFGKRIINVASISPTQPSEDDLWDMMLTRRAKRAEQV